MRHAARAALVLLILAAAGGAALAFRSCRGTPHLPVEPRFSPGWKLPSGTLKVVTYNIEFGNRLEEALNVLRAESPDVVCLQEIRPGQMKSIERSLGMEGFWFASSNLIGDGAWGNAVLARGRVREGQSFPNPAGGSLGAWAAVEVDGCRFLAGSIHLMHAKTEGAGFGVRGREIRAMLDAVAKVGGPAIIAGDFNNPPIGGNYEQLTSRLTDLSAKSGPTLPSRFPVVRIDYIFGTREWEAVSAESLSTTVSDHRPVAAVVKARD